MYRPVQDGPSLIKYLKSLILGHDPLDREFLNDRLRHRSRFPLMATEYAPGGFTSYVPWIVNRATDYLRGHVAIKAASPR